MPPTDGRAGCDDSIGLGRPLAVASAIHWLKFNLIALRQKAPFIAGLPGGFIQTRSTCQRCNLLGHRPTDQFGIIGDRLGSADEIALDFLTGLAHQEIQLGLGFDALGSNWKVEPATETDYGTDDGFRLLIPLQVRDECPVDLDLVEWEGL